MRPAGTRCFISLSLTGASESPASLPPPHAQPSRPPTFYRHHPRWNISRRQQAYPILLPEGSPERDRPIMLHNPMPRHQSKHPTTPLRPFQIVDKPTQLYGRFHPPQQRHDLFVLQMMCQQRTNDDIHRLLRPIHQSIAGQPCNSELLWRGLRCCARRIRIQVDSR